MAITVLKNKARGILLQRCESAMVADNFVSENAINGIELNIRSNHSSVQGNVCGSNKNQVCELPDQRDFGRRKFLPQQQRICGGIYQFPNQQL